MKANHNGLCTGAPRLRRTSSVAPVSLAWLVATLLLLGGAPPGHAQTGLVPDLGSVQDRTFLKDQAVDTDLSTTAADPVVLPEASGGDGTLTYGMACALTETDCDAVSKLPPGLVFTPSDRTLSGTPTAAGTWNIDYWVTDADDDSDKVTFEIEVLDLPVLSFGHSSAAEGASGERPQMIFTVTLSPASARTVKVNHRDGGGGSDGFQIGVDADTASMFGTVTFNRGETEKNFDVTIIGDNQVEADETFQIQLLSPTNAKLAGGGWNLQRGGTIRNDDPTMTIGDARVYEGQSGTTTLSFPVRLNAAVGSAVKVDYEDAGTGGATSGTDYAAISNATLTIPSGETSGSIDVTVNGDTTDEGDETVVVRISDPQGAWFPERASSLTATGTIVDDEGPPTVSVDGFEVAEGDGTHTANFKVSLAYASASDITVDYQDDATGTATSGTDYTAITAGTLTITAGDTSADIPVSILGDTTDEPDETVVIKLSNASNAVFAGGASSITGTGTIENDDNPMLSIDAPSVAEGDSGTVTLTWKVSLNAVSNETVTVKFADAGTGDATSGTDYTAITAGTLTFAPGDTEKSIDVTVNGDTDDESDETIVIKLSDLTNAEFSGGASSITGTGTIENDDDPVLSIDTPTVAEGDSGTATLTFTVTLSAASHETVTVNYADAGTGTATSGTGTGADYTAPTAGALTFDPGQTSKTIGVTVNGDTADEPDETVVIKLSGLANAEFSGGGTELTGTGTIENDDDPELYIDAPSVVEGDSGTTALTWKVRLSAASSGVVTVKYADAGTGTAASSGDDADYTLNLGTLGVGTLSIPAGTTEAFIRATVNGDTTDEPDETVVIKLSDLTGAEFSGGGSELIGAGTIENDDDPELYIDSPAVFEGDSGTVTLRWTVRLSAVSHEDVKVSYADTGNGTATSSGDAADYDALSAGTLTIGSGATVGFIDVTVNGDTTDEPDETIRITISGVENAVIPGGGATFTAIGLIRNDDDPVLSIDAPSVAEGDSGTTTLTFTVTLSPAGNLASTVKYADAGSGGGGTATSGTDYAALTAGTLTFAPNETEKTIEVTVNGDTDDETDETVVIKLSEPTNAQFADGASTGTGTIENDDDPVLSIDAPSVVEGDSDTTTLTWTVTLSPASGDTVTVSYEDAGTGTAASSGSDADYTAPTAGTLTFAPNETEKTIAVTVNGDTVDENDETVVIKLSDAVNAVLAGGGTELTGTGTVENDDDPVLAIDAPSVAEGGDEDTPKLIFTVTMEPASSDTITVAYKDAGTDGGGTATSADDYEAVPAGTLTFAPNETEKTIEVTVNGDGVDEPNETVVIELSSPVNAQFADGAAEVTGTGTIENDDNPVMTIEDKWVAEGNTGTTTLNIGVRLSGPSHEAVAVSYADAGTGTAASSGADADYSGPGVGLLYFSAGSTYRSVSVTVNGDTVDEPDETVAIKISGPTNATFPDGAAELVGTGTIRNDDNALALGVEQREEGDDGTTTFKFTVTLTDPAGDAGVKVSYRDVTADVTGYSNLATSGTDYEAVSAGKLEFSSGENSKSVEVTVNADRDDESDELITLEFHSPENALFAGNDITERATAVILNDDGSSQLARTVSIDSPTVDEGDDGTTTLTFTVERSGGTQSVVSVDYADAGTGNAIAGEDYEAISSGTLTFQEGETSKTIDVTVNGDTATELNETVVIALSNAMNAELPTDPTGTGTITNDDEAVVTIDDPSVDEGDGEAEEVPARLEFTLRLSGPVSHTVTVDYADTGEGTATSGSDYDAVANGTLTFASGEIEKTLTLTVHGDTTVEHHETVVIAFSNPVGAVFPDEATELTATGTIHSDDGTPAPAGGSGAPVADAGADFEVDPEAAVTLDGSGSSDPEGEALIFAWSAPSGAEVSLSGADTAAPSFTAPWQPGGLVFGLTVTDPGGLAASDAVTVTVRDLAPAFGSAAVPSPVLVVGEAMEALVLPEASGGNGTLTYGLTSAPAGLAGLSFDPATRQLSGTPTEEGSYDFTWRAEDADENRADSDAAVLTFGVTVEDPRTALVRKTMKRTLAAVARRSLSSALENIGARFASSIPDSGLTLAGATVPFGAAGTPGWAGTPGLEGAVGLNGVAGLVGAPGRNGVAGLGGAPGLNGEAVLNGTAGGCFASAPHRHRLRAEAHGCPAADIRSRDVETDEMLRTSAFSLTLGAAEESGPGGSPGARWAVWGRGDLGTFAGRPEPGVRYDGELRTGWLGIDARAGRWVAGLALSHGRGEADYGFDENGVSGQGRLETTLNALYPYGRWTFAEGLELRAVLGAGNGEAHHVPDDGPPETSDLSMRMASLGVRRELPAMGEVGLAVRADASVARLETDSGPQYIDNLTADTWRGRVGVEASRPFTLGEEAELTPFVEAAGRRDGGDGLTGAGLELAGGVRYRAPGLELEARGRWLAAHTEAGARERGVSVTARVGPGAHGRGLSLLLSPRWGAETDGAETLWSEEMPELSGDDAASLDARVGYGLALSPRGPLAPRGLLTPFAETGLGGGDRQRLRLGTRFDASGMDLGVELAGERVERDATDPEHALTLDVTFRF